MNGKAQTIFLLVLLGMVSLLTFNRGGFFAYEAMPAVTATLGLFLLAWWLFRIWIPRGGLILGGVILWLTAWVLSLSRAVHLGLALEELLRNAMYVCTFLLVYFFIRERSVRNLAAGLLVGLGALEALAGLGTAYGTFSFASAYNEELRRVMGTMQYPNALAGYLSMIFILGLYISEVVTDRRWQASIAAASYLLFTGILSAQSRGATLVLLLVLLPTIAFWPRSGRLLVFFRTVQAVVLAFLTARWTVDFSGEVSEGVHWLALLTGMLLAALLSAVSVPAAWRERGSKYGRVLAGIVLLAIFVGGSWFFVRSGGLLERLAQFDWQDRNVQERLVFYKDGLKMLKDYPLTGAGGGGWRTLFEKYQSYRYISRETHSYPLKVLVETGIIGFIAYIIVFGGFFTLVLLKWWKEKSLPPLAWASFWAVLLVTLHSFIDFTLSLSAITVTMWLIMALTLGELETKQVVRPRPMWLTLSGSAVILVLLVLAAKISLAEQSYRAAQQAMQRQELALAADQLRQAIEYNSWKADYYRDRFAVLLALARQQGSPEIFNEAVEAARQAVKRDAFSPINVSNYGKALLMQGQIEQGMNELEKLTTLAPYDIRTWEMLMQIYRNTAEYYLQLGDTAKARVYRAKMQEVPVRMAKVWQQIPEKYKRLWNAGPKLEVTDTMKKLLTE